ncbi:hypothetical protein PV11_03580 [Exophiala sideris]|uniref:Cupin 2 conserved barrel domain-containing protein n=1 Tax=Exophiala sideris TaxID=1016849 RepID=A0A0D1YK51_9EURO|nr:hypothetical protein PV11_03580 [Exophiala sideris]
MPIENTVQNLPDRIAKITKSWTQQHVLSLNDSHSIKIATFEGDFIWHSHPDTDEVFYCVSGGPFYIDIATAEPDSEIEREGYTTAELKVGDILCIPRTIRHRPRAPVLTGVTLTEKIGTVNTGDEADKSVLTVNLKEGQ